MSLSSEKPENLNQDELSLDVLYNMKAMVALWKVIQNEKGELDLRLESVNKYWAETMNMTTEEAKGLLFSVVGASDAAWISVIADIANGKAETSIVETYSEAAKLHFHTQMYSPKTGYIVIIHNNRTQFVKTVAEQENREKKVSSLFQLMPSGFAICDMIYDDSDKPIDVSFDMLNNVFEIMCGFRVGSLQGKRLLDEYPDYRTDLFDIFDSVVKIKQKETFMMHTPNTDRIYEVICYPQGEKRFLSITNDITERAKAEKALKEAHETIIAGIEYSSKIQTNLLPLDSAMGKAFSDYSVIWKPRDIVGGDIYWMKQFETGTVLVVADCTGHGTPGALLTMLVVSQLEAEVLPDNCHDTAGIMWELEKRLVEVFSVKSDGRKVSRNDIQEGCDLAVLFIANDGNVNLSAGHTNVYVCDGKEVKRIKGQRLNVGEGKIRGKDEIKTVHIAQNPDNKFYIASDGLSDQSGWESDEPFGYSAMGEIALANHNKPLSEITATIWAAFEKHRGNKPRLDDFELVAFKP